MHLLPGYLRLRGSASESPRPQGRQPQTRPARPGESAAWVYPPFGERAHANLIPKSRSHRNAERPGSLPACCVTCPWCGACSPRRWGRSSAPASSLYLLTCHAPGAHPEGLVVFPLHAALHAAVVAGVYHLEQLVADHPVKGPAEPPEVVPRHKPHDGA